jgi:hypothetical protein
MFWTDLLVARHKSKQFICETFQFSMANIIIGSKKAKNTYCCYNDGSIIKFVSFSPSVSCKIVDEEST